MKKLLMVLVIYSAGCSILAEDQSSGLPWGPYGIPGMHPYYYFVTGFSQHDQMLIQLVRASEDTTGADYHAVDSFSCGNSPRACGGNSISYVTEEDSCFHIVTLGPLPGTQRDTIVTSCMPDSVAWNMADYLVVKENSLFANVLLVHIHDPIRKYQCLIGRIGDGGQIDTVALLYGVGACNPSFDKTELFLDVLFDPDQNGFPRFTVGVYDLVADSLLMPLDTTYDTRWGYRLGRDKPLYYIKNHPVHGINVWRWDEEWGEQLVTYYPKPDRVTGFVLTADSVICYVRMEPYSDSTGLTRVAVPIDGD